MLLRHPTGGSPSPFAFSRALLAIGLAAAGGTGCVVGSGDPVAPLAQDAGQSSEPYPAGPYGVGVGSVIRNYEFAGYVDPSQGIGAARRVSLSLGDFYNPTGQGLYADGSPFGAGSPVPKALVINVSAVWCVSCKLEAQTVLPQQYAAFHPRGGELLMDLAESAEPGKVAGFEQLDGWVSTFDVRYPAVIDPSYQLGSMFDSSSFPANILVDTSDMTVVESVAGVPEESFWLKLEQLLDAP